MDRKELLELINRIQAAMAEEALAKKAKAIEVKPAEVRGCQHPDKAVESLGVLQKHEHFICKKCFESFSRLRKDVAPMDIGGINPMKMVNPGAKPIKAPKLNPSMGQTKRDAGVGFLSNLISTFHGKGNKNWSSTSNAPTTPASGEVKVNPQPKAIGEINPLDTVKPGAKPIKGTSLSTDLGADKKAAGIGFLSNLISTFHGKGNDTWENLRGAGSTSGAKTAGRTAARMALSEHDMAKDAGGAKGTSVEQANKEMQGFKSIASNHPPKVSPQLASATPTTPKQVESEMKGFQSLAGSIPRPKR